MRKKIEVNTEELERMVIGMGEMCEALERECFGYTAEGILSQDNKTEGENAAEYVRSYVDLLAGAMKTVSAGLHILSEGIANDEIAIVIK